MAERFFQVFADDLIYAAAMAICLIVPGMQTFIPYVVAIKTKSDGGSWGEAVTAGVQAYTVQQIATSPGFETAGNAVSSYTSVALGGGTLAVSFGNLLGSATQSGLASGTVSVVSGESFTDGFQSAFIGSIVSQGTGKVLGYIEDKLPDGLKYETQARNDDGQIVDASGRRVYESKAGTGANGPDDITKLVTDNGVVRKAANVLETFPPVVQDMISTAIAAELQGKDVTPEMMYGVMANTYVTVEVVGSVLGKVPGVDFSSPEGQNFLTYLTPAIQQSVVQAASMGLTAESGALAGQNLLESIEKYGSDELFKNILGFVEDSPIVQDIFAMVDDLTFKTKAAKDAAEQAEEASAAYGEPYQNLML